MSSTSCRPLSALPETVHILAVFTAKPGRRDDVLAELQPHVATVRAEDGCLGYHVVVDAEGLGAFQTKFGPDSFVVIETWASLEAASAHSAAPHSKSFGAKSKHMLASRVIHVLSPA